jgi:hypothetical protein
VQHTAKSVPLCDFGGYPRSFIRLYAKCFQNFCGEPKRRFPCGVRFATRRAISFSGDDVKNSRLCTAAPLSVRKFFVNNFTVFVKKMIF